MGPDEAGFCRPMRLLTVGAKMTTDKSLIRSQAPVCSRPRVLSCGKLRCDYGKEKRVRTKGQRTLLTQNKINHTVEVLHYRRADVGGEHWKTDLNSRNEANKTFFFDAFAVFCGRQSNLVARLCVCVCVAAARQRFGGHPL